MEEVLVWAWGPQNITPSPQNPRPLFSRGLAAIPLPGLLFRKRPQPSAAHFGCFGLLRGAGGRAAGRGATGDRAGIIARRRPGPGTYLIPPFSVGWARVPASRPALALALLVLPWRRACR